MSLEIWNRRYTGSKYKLVEWISGLIDEHCKGNSFCDIFAGTGVLSYVLTTLKTDRNSSLSDRPALPLVA